MPTRMYIFGEAGLWNCRRHAASAEYDLERDLDNFLQDRGEVIHDRDEHSGPQWNVDLLLHTDADDVEGWIQRLTAFLRRWGVPDRTLSFTIIRDGATSKWEHRRVDIAGAWTAPNELPLTEGS